MRDHIHTVVGRYKGRIHGWDVVNEAIDEDGSLRKSPWQDGIGDDYVAKAFEFAHEADPDAELYYNDFNLEKPAKRAGVIKLVKDLQARKLRIDGIGNQAHWRLDTPTIDEIDEALVELHGTGLKVMYSELDINLLPNTPRGADPAAAEPVRERPARRDAAAARPTLRGHVRRLREASRCRHAGHVLGPERRRFMAEPRTHELSAALGSAAPAEAGIPGRRRGAEACAVRAATSGSSASLRASRSRRSSLPPSWLPGNHRPRRGWRVRLRRPPRLSLWYRAPASDHPLLPAGASREARQAGTAEWVRALPVGNGRLGAMVFGGVVHERLQLNEDTLWAGRPYDPVNPDAKDGASRSAAAARRAQVSRGGERSSTRR